MQRLEPAADKEAEPLTGFARKIRFPGENHPS